MKKRTKYVVHMTEDDVKNIRTAFTFVKNAFITHLRHTSDHDSVMSVMGTLGHIIEQLDMQVEKNEKQYFIAEQIDKLLKEIQDDD